MAHFLTTTDSSAAIERVIREAERSLTLISAFVAPRIVHLQRLRDAAERGIETVLGNAISDTGFRASGHRLDVVGTCADCN